METDRHCRFPAKKTVLGDRKMTATYCTATVEQQQHNTKRQHNTTDPIETLCTALALQRALTVTVTGERSYRKQKTGINR